jgi:2,4-diaminopentanoate dehydrogenase
LVYRVVHWGTGATGRHALGAVLDRADLELVGLYAWNADKAGKDAGTLIGRAPVGIAATQDLDALIALKPDVVTYFGNGVRDAGQTAADIARFLRAGINVVTSSMTGAIHPHGSGDAALETLREACKAGGASLFASGVDPGFATGMLSVAAFSAAHKIDRVRLQEFANYGNYPDEQTGRHIWGFGLPLDAQTLVSTGVMLRSAWTGTLEANARALGWTVADFRTTCLTAPAGQDYATAIGTVAKGTTSAVWFQLIGVVGGAEKIVLEHINWIDAGDIPEGWPVPPQYRGALAETSYRICVEGQPAYDIELAMGDGDTDGLGITAMHCINSIPMVVDAEPGIVDQCAIVPFGPGG